MVNLSDENTKTCPLEPCVPYPQDTEIIANIVTSAHHLSATMVTGRQHRMTELFAQLAPGADLQSARRIENRLRFDAARPLCVRQRHWEPGTRRQPRSVLSGTRRQCAATDAAGAAGVQAITQLPTSPANTASFSSLTSPAAPTARNHRSLPSPLAISILLLSTLSAGDLIPATRHYSKGLAVVAQ
jgi:hypothetical protein